MSTKHFYRWSFLLAVFFAGFVSCTKNREARPHAVIILSDSSLAVSGEQGQYTVRIVTNTSLKVQTNVEWIKVPDSVVSDKQDTQFTFYVAVNEGKTERNGVITLEGPNGLQSALRILQKRASGKSLFVKEDGDNNNQGLSWNNATSLENALTHAVNGATIHIAAGIYTPAHAISGGDPADEGDKTFHIDKNLTIIGGYPKDATEGAGSDPDKYRTVLSGENTAYHVITISAPVSDSGENVILEGLTITKGHSEKSNSTSIMIDGEKFVRNTGGGILIGGSHVTMEACRVIENEGFNGGGIYATRGATLELKQCQVNNNMAGSHTGGIYIRSGSKATMYDTEVKSNVSTSVGAGVFCYDDTEVDIYNSVISENESGNYGGGVYVRGNSTCNLINVVIAGNKAGGSGGGIFVYANSNLNVVSSTIVENSTDGKSGGLFLRNGENIAHIVNSIISGNKQQDNDADVAVNTDSHPDPMISASVIGDFIFDTSWEQMIGVSFDFTTMMERLDDGTYLPTEGDYPVRKLGLSAVRLADIGKDLGLPETEEDILSQDISHHSRQGLSIMGAVIE